VRTTHRCSKRGVWVRRSGSTSAHQDEGLLPTGTFRRAARARLTRAKELGVATIALPTRQRGRGMGGVWRASRRRVVVVMPETTPQVIQRETAAYGADVWLVRARSPTPVRW